MPGKRMWVTGALLALLASAGCCSWCNRHCGCGTPATVVPAASAPAAGCCPPPPCCCPVGTAPIQPVPAAPPPPASVNYARPANGCGPG
jgi:hypothetical protein